MLYANYNTKTQQTPRAKWSERPKPKPSETKTKSHEPSAKWSQVKPSEAKWSQVKPKAKWARKWEILAPKCMQNTDFSSKMPQIARKAAPGCKTKKNTSKKKYTLHHETSAVVGYKAVTAVGSLPSLRLRHCQQVCITQELLARGCGEKPRVMARVMARGTAISMGTLWERKYMNILFLVGGFNLRRWKMMEWVRQVGWWNYDCSIPN